MAGGVNRRLSRRQVLIGGHALLISACAFGGAPTPSPVPPRPTATPSPLPSTPPTATSTPATSLKPPAKPTVVVAAKPTAAAAARPLPESLPAAHCDTTAMVPGEPADLLMAVAQQSGLLMYDRSSRPIAGGQFTIDTSELRIDYAKTDWVTSDAEPFAFSRHYSSRATTPSTLGPGWYHSFGFAVERVQPASPERYVIRGLFPFEAAFESDGQGRFGNPKFPGYRLLKNNLGSFVLTTACGSTAFFDSKGRLLERTSSNKNTARLSYDAAGQITVAEPMKRRPLRLIHNAAGRLTRIEDWQSPARAIEFAYDAKGRLITVTEPGGATNRYTYVGATHLLTSIVDGNGNPAITLGYTNGTYAWRQDAAGNRIEASLEKLPDGGHRVTTVYPASAFAPNHQVTDVDRYDKLQRFVRGEITFAPNEPPRVTEQTYSGSSYMVTGDRRGGGATTPPAKATPATEDPLAKVAYLLRDPRALLRTAIRQRLEESGGVFEDDALGRPIVFQAHSAALEHVLWQPDLPVAQQAGAFTWRLAYDERGLLQSAEVSGPGGTLKRSFEYDKARNLTLWRTAEGEHLRFGYDAMNRLGTVEFQGGHAVKGTLGYDKRGLLHQVRLANPNGTQGFACDVLHDGLKRPRRLLVYRDWAKLKDAVTYEYHYDERDHSALFLLPG